MPCRVGLIKADLGVVQVQSPNLADALHAVLEPADRDVQLPGGRLEVPGVLEDDPQGGQQPALMGRIVSQERSQPVLGVLAHLGMVSVQEQKLEGVHAVHMHHPTAGFDAAHRPKDGPALFVGLRSSARPLEGAAHAHPDGQPLLGCPEAPLFRQGIGVERAALDEPNQPPLPGGADAPNVAFRPVPARYGVPSAPGRRGRFPA